MSFAVEYRDCLPLYVEDDGRRLRNYPNSHGTRLDTRAPRTLVQSLYSTILRIMVYEAAPSVPR